MANSAYTPSQLRAPILVEPEASGVKCNGGSVALGHPEVYYSFDGRSEVTCEYCGQQFMKTK